MAVKKSPSGKHHTTKKSPIKSEMLREQNGGNQTVVVESVNVSEYEVRQRAYEIYQARGCQHGFDWDDWIKAEAEIRSRLKETA